MSAWQLHSFSIWLLIAVNPEAEHACGLVERWHDQQQSSRVHRIRNLGDPQSTQMVRFSVPLAGL